MSRKNIIILVGFVLVLALALIFFIRRDSTSPLVQSLSGLLPGGGDTTIQTNTPSLGNETSAQGEDTGADGVVPKIRQVTTFPVAGVTTFMRGGSEIIRYVARQDGNVYETRADSLATTRLSNMTIPRIQEALWWGEGKGLLLRYLDGETVKTFSATLATSTTIGEGRLVGTFLPDNITELAVNPKGDKIFYLQTKNTGAVGTLSNPDGSKGSTVFSSPLKDWLVSWPESNTLLLSTKPLTGAFGSVYFFDLTKKALSPVSSGSAIMALARPNLKTIFYTAEIGNREASFILSNSSPVESTVTTFPDKCAWGKIFLFCGAPSDTPSPEASLAWYRGESSLSDDIWSIDTQSNVAGLEATFPDQPHDVTNPLVTPQDTHFLFIDKNDLTLWSVKLAQ